MLVANILGQSQRPPVAMLYLESHTKIEEHTSRDIFQTQGLARYFLLSRFTLFVQRFPVLKFEQCKRIRSNQHHPIPPIILDGTDSQHSPPFPSTCYGLSRYTLQDSSAPNTSFQAKCLAWKRDAASTLVIKDSC